MQLPKLTLRLTERNPDWIGEYIDNKCINMENYQLEYDIEVEVVTLNLNTGTMRIRYMWPDKNVKKGKSMQSRDVSIDSFYRKYTINEVDYEQV